MAEENDPDATDTEEEFRGLFDDARAQKLRFQKMAQESSDPVVRQVLSELSGTVMSMIEDLIASTGGAFGDVERRLDDIEDRVEDVASFLTHEDGQQFLMYLEQVAGFLTNILTVAEKTSTDEQTAAEIAKLRALLELTEDRIEFVKSVTGEPDAEGDPDAEDEDEETEDEDEESSRQDA